MSANIISAKYLIKYIVPQLFKNLCETFSRSIYDLSNVRVLKIF
jgi:hypothetical protein